MNKVIEAILNYVEPEEEITLDSKLKGDCGLSSFDMICLVEELSDTFNVTADSVELKKCVTVRDLCVLFGETEEETV